MTMKGMELWKLRKEAGLTQRQLAKLIGKNSTWICRREQNNDHPDWMPITKAEERMIRNAINHKVVMDGDSDGGKVDEVIALKEKIEELTFAISDECYHCKSHKSKNIKECPATGCHFWPYRPFQKND